MAIEDTLFETVSVNGILIPVSSKSINLDPDVRVVRATGKRTPWDSFVGKLEATGKIEFFLDENSVPLLSLAIADAGQKLTEFEFDDGHNLYTGCKVSDLSISLRAGEELTASLDFIITGKDTSTLSGEAVLSNPFIGQGIVLTGFPVKEVEDIDIAVSNTLTALFSLKKTDRLPVHYAEGFQDTKVDLKYIEDPELDNWADSIDKVASGSIAVKTADGTKTLTISFTNLLPDAPTEDVDTENVRRFGLSFIGHTISFNVAP